jgi:hypothetical protein
MTYKTSGLDEWSVQCNGERFLLYIEYWQGDRGNGARYAVCGGERGLFIRRVEYKDEHPSGEYKYILYEPASFGTYPVLSISTGS